MSERDLDHMLWALAKDRSVEWTATGLDELAGRTVEHVYCEFLLLDNGDVVAFESYSLIGESGGGYSMQVCTPTREQVSAAHALPSPH